MAKAKISQPKRVTEYIRELSIVIIGIAITLGLSGIISKVQKNKELKIQLNAIQVELEDNLNNLDEIIRFYELHDKFQEFLLKSLVSNDQAVSDSVSKYSYIIGWTADFHYKRGAYEMFLNSGISSLIKDKQLLMGIIESYIMMEATKEVATQYTNMKINESLKLIEKINPKNLGTNIDIRKAEYNSTFNFYASINQMDYYPREAKEQINKVLEIIKQK